MYRADLPRSFSLVAVLLFMAASTGVFAREFHRDTQSDDHPTVQALHPEERSRQQAGAAGVTIVSDFDRRPFEAAMAAIYEQAERDPASAALIERIRKVE